MRYLSHAVSFWGGSSEGEWTGAVVEIVCGRFFIKVSVLGKARSRSGEDNVFSSWGKVAKEY